MSRRLTLLRLYNHACLYCDVSLDFFSITIEHLLPRSKGGTNNIANLAAACKRCNNLRGNQDLDTWLLDQNLDRRHIHAKLRYAQILLAHNLEFSKNEYQHAKHSFSVADQFTDQDQIMLSNYTPSERITEYNKLRERQKYLQTCIRNYRVHLTHPSENMRQQASARIDSYTCQLIVCEDDLSKLEDAMWSILKS